MVSISGKRLFIMGCVLTIVHTVCFHLMQTANVSAFDVSYGSWVALLCVYLNSGKQR